MTKSNKILCIIGAILIAFVGLFGIVFASMDDRVVKADTNSSYPRFDSNVFTIPISLCNSNSSYSSSTISNSFSFFSFELSLNSYNTSKVGIDYSSTSANNQIWATSSMADLPLDSSNYWNSKFLTLGSSGAYGSYRYYVVAYHMPSDFNYNVYKIVINNYSDGSAFGFAGFSEFLFYDTNDNFFVIQFPYNKSGNLIDAQFFVPARTIFIENLSTLTDNQYYQTGYSNGYDVGNSAGYNTGYNAGYDVGNSAGYNTGYNAGIENANDYTFLGLIGATIDAPISAFTSFFDFELLGVNLKDFFFAILTFALVIVIIRFALGR